MSAIKISLACVLAGGTMLATRAPAATIFEEDFEAPYNTDVNAANSAGNTSGATPTDWVRATQGFGANRNGLVDESSGQFIDPTGEQAHAFRYTNSGLTTKEGVIGALTAGLTYTVSFDVVMDGYNSGLPYVADLFVWNPGARRDDVRANSFGTLLAGTSGSATSDGLYTNVSFTFAPDPVTHAALIGGDLTLRFKGASSSGNIDNVKVQAVPEPGSLALLGLGAGFIGGRRRRSR